MAASGRYPNREVHRFSLGDGLLIAVASMAAAVKAGVLEEALFRGFLMKLLENRWNRRVAVLAPSVLFSLAHIPSMDSFTAEGVALLVISGSLVGVMFSLVAYQGNAIGNSVLLHSMWNFVIASDILHITTAQGAYGTPLFQITLPSGNALLTGAGFGAEASFLAILGYAAVCCAVLFLQKKSL